VGSDLDAVFQRAFPVAVVDRSNLNLCPHGLRRKGRER
jgi:hypothetical protein